MVFLRFFSADFDCFSDHMIKADQLRVLHIILANLTIYTLLPSISFLIPIPTLLHPSCHLCRPPHYQLVLFYLFFGLVWHENRNLFLGSLEVVQLS